MSILTETDIANRALQRLGATRIAANALWTEDSQNASEMRAVYDIVRRTELRRNVWKYSIREQILRPIDSDTVNIVFPLWDSRLAYAGGDIVRTGDVGTDGSGLWIAGSANTNINPDSRDLSTWHNYFGVTCADVYDATVSYSTGELVFDTTEDGNPRWYFSKLNDNLGNALSDTTWWRRLSPVHWTIGASYTAGFQVYYNGVSYVALQANTGQQPDISPTYWGTFTDFGSSVVEVLYPVGAGPASQTQTRNFYRVPANFMRMAPQAPRQGSYQILGFPSNLFYNDWQFEGRGFTTVDSGPIPFRFTADIQSPSSMDPMFVDGFACRLAVETCERITQSVSKVQELTALYNKFMSEARMVNGIETGPTEPPLDSYITVRF